MASTTQEQRRGQAQRGESDWRAGRFHNLIPRQVEHILLVANEYDSFTLEEDGLLAEDIFSEYPELGLGRAPRVTRVTGGREALQVIRKNEDGFDLVITTLKIGGADIFSFSRALAQENPELPVALLIPNELELERLGPQRDQIQVDSKYVWHGDAKLFYAIVKSLEDRWNVDHDTQTAGIGVIILVEDSIRFRSLLLPIMYAELTKQMQSVLLDGLNRRHKLLSLRARPKILVAENYDQALALYEKYRNRIFGIITDVSFDRAGHRDPQAGYELIQELKQDNSDLPCLLQSSDLENRTLADRLQVAFMHKHSSAMLEELQEFMLTSFGFGEFVFRLPDQRPVGKAIDLRSMAQQLRSAPIESIVYHASRNHFSNWLRARTEFALADELRPVTVEQFQQHEQLRTYLVEAFSHALARNRRGIVEDFTSEHFDEATQFAKIGAGSLGGKARGLVFIDALLARVGDDPAFHGARVFVPRSVVIATDAFDRFLDENGLRGLALAGARSDRELLAIFRRGRLPTDVRDSLRTFLLRVTTPLAVRSSSLLEDSQYYPFAGVYETIMVANSHADPETRLRQLEEAVKTVYASTFYEAARNYFQSTPHHLQEQKMAVLIEPIIGRRCENYYYPEIAGVVRSYNFYPFAHMKPEDGVASVGLGLGQLVVEGGEALRFCPTHPHVLPQMSGGRSFIEQSQRGFFALDLDKADVSPLPANEHIITRLELDAAERHGTLAAIGSVWSHENNCFYDSIYRPGVRVITFAPILKADVFPLTSILNRILEIGRLGMGGPVEMEFAANIRSDPPEFAVLQLRPYGAGGDYTPVDIDHFKPADLLCLSHQALGNGIVGDLTDILYVRPDTFDAGKTREIAREIAARNDIIRSAGRPYLLIGPGRWGSSNPWLGIPVTWPQISGAKAIVETALENFTVDPSQGSHFFHNLTSLGVAYLTVHPQHQQEKLDWEWLRQQPTIWSSEYLRHVRLERPVQVHVDGRRSKAAVVKPLVELESRAGEE